MKGWYAPGLAALALVAAATQGSAAEVHAGDSEQNWEPSEVHVKPGEQVTWTFENPNMVHNVESSTPNWSLTSDIVTNHPPVTYTFTAPGTYGFICHVHGSMVGTVIVDGDATPAPTPTVTPTVTPTQTPVPTATATPVPPAPVVTLPAPTPVATPAPVDRTRPTVTALKLSAVRHGAKVRFKLSEAATVTIKGTRGSKTLKTATVRAKAGTRTVTLRASRITPGRLTVEVQARDEAGNRSASARRALTIRR